jgi:hypothetical protein
VALIPRAPLYTPRQTRSGQPPQPFPNNSGIYTTVAVLALGTALMAQAPSAPRPQQVQPFQNPGRLYVPIPFGAQVLATPRALASQAPQPFGNTFGLYAGAATSPPLGATVYDNPRAALQVQAPQPFGNPLSLYTSIAYVPPSATIAAQVQFAPRSAQTTLTPALVTYSTAYVPPPANIAAQINRTQAQPAGVSSAPLSLYSATYTWPAQRIDAQSNRASISQGFAQSARLGLYQPQVYRPPQAPRIDNPTRLPYSFAYQGRVQASPFGLYTAVLLPISGTTPTVSAAGSTGVSGPADATVFGSSAGGVAGSDGTVSGSNDGTVFG